MNFIDIFFLLLFVAALAAGFFQGMIRLFVLLVAFYLSVVLASLYFPALATVFQTRFGTPRYVGEYVGFMLILMVGFILLTVAGLYTFRYAHLPGQLQYVDRVIGVLLGVVLGALFIGIFAVLLWNLMILRGGCTIDFPIMRMLCGGVSRSFLLQYFSRELLPATYDLIRPILPAGARIIFVVQ